MTRFSKMIRFLTTQQKDLPKPKRQRIEETPLKLPEVFMEGDFPPKNQLIPFLQSLCIKKDVHMNNKVPYCLNLQ